MPRKKVATNSSGSTGRQKGNSNQNGRRRRSRGGGGNKAGARSSLQAATPGVGWGTGVKLSGCARDYLQCLANPVDGPLSCIPDYPALFSLRQRPYVKGTFQTSNTAGGISFGWILADPLRSAAQDLTCVVSTLSTYATLLTNLASGATITNSHSNASYAYSTFGAGQNLVQVRVVSAVLRIRYAGTELNRGGQCVALMHPNHESLNNVAFSGFDAFDESKRFPITKEWVSVLYRPVDNTDLFYTGDPTQDSNAAAPYAPGSFYMGFAIMDPGGTASPATYEYEFYSVCEYQGQSIRGKMPSSYDPIGFGVVHGATQHRADLLHPSNKSLTKIAVDFASAALKYAGEEVTTVQRVPRETLALDARAPGQGAGFDWWGAIKGIGSAIAPYAADLVGMLM